jgi:hypothetical protein
VARAAAGPITEIIINSIHHRALRDEATAISYQHGVESVDIMLIVSTGC